MVITYRCPYCGSSMTYEAGEGKLRCEHCESLMTVEEARLRQEGECETAAGEAPAPEGELRRYHCPGCGAEMVTDEYTMANVCSFCGSPDLILDRMSGEEKPEWILPFTIGREEAESCFLAWAKKGRLTPADFTSRKTLDRLTGMYVPFWLYDLEADAALEAACTNTYVTRLGQVESIHTRHYRVERQARAEYERMPADASLKMDDTLMDQMEPFRYDQIRPFEMPYLAGYVAERFNRRPEELFERVETRAKAYAAESLRETVSGYQTVNVENCGVRVGVKKAAYALLPVWMLHYRYRGKEYRFTMNGNTGKIIGEVPVCRRKMALWGAGIAGAAFVVLSLLSLLTGGVL